MWRLVIIPLVLFAMFARSVVNGLNADAEYMTNEFCLARIDGSIASAIARTPQLYDTIEITREWRVLDDTEEKMVLDTVLATGNTLSCPALKDAPLGQAFAGDNGWINVTTKGRYVLIVRVELKNGSLRRY